MQIVLDFFIFDVMLVGFICDFLMVTLVLGFVLIRQPLMVVQVMHVVDGAMAPAFGETRVP